MHIHILGICGTFMGGLALIARAAGHTVTGCDAGVYPPMSTQLENEGIQLIEGFDASQTELKPDLYIIGNIVSRGNPLMEEILEKDLPYLSGPQWLNQYILQNQHVLAVAGTHGKTTTASMLTWILKEAGLSPNFLIGGVAPGLQKSAHYNSQHSLFVIEADEYDTAFFDKRSKFVHYRPRTLILNNLEYDHADIFPDLAAIERQFHHVIRLVPQSGQIIYPADDANLARVLAMGCWSESQTIADATAWSYQPVNASGEQFKVFYKQEEQGTVNWSLTGTHNIYNALAAIAAAHHAGLSPTKAIEALNRFEGIKRRMELKATIHNIKVYDDFAHHPTAIATTLEGLRNQVGSERIIAILEPRSNTMKLGAMAARLPEALQQADQIFCYAETTGKHALEWNPAEVFKDSSIPVVTQHQLDKLVDEVCQTAKPGDHLLIMSNGGFGGFHDKLIQALTEKHQ